jgi:hypothetical protein
MIVAALVLPETGVGMIEASATRSPLDAVRPEFSVDHRVGSLPILDGPPRPMPISSSF